ncbi:glycosyltransferase [Herbiconiux sp. CPCC 203407]|uniref:D-inositol 3-phosphate glycosyltransferase n=1 Tax=Herbiconiux oxytropis TaxID=2970915 RepID=A0AA42BVZ0_9MICO|nr:glycosyltransferase [Herbiconiux oxytropis]MCS5723172.1 glycosyltransferase [Herbiconiux oxytropis]MCS5725153.1 glycosyltransferase [Herbiconiux oxytropis]
MSFRVALISLHTSPLAGPGSGDAGGMNVYLVGLAEALAQAGTEVELITRDAGEGATDARTPGGVLVRFLRAGPRAPVPKGELPAQTPEFARSLAQLPRFDVVHSHYWLSGLAGLEAARAWRAPHILSLHTVAALKNERLAPGDRPEPAERLSGERMLVRASARTVTATDAERLAVLDAAGPDLDDGRVVVVAPGVDPSLFHPREPAAPDPYLLVLARIQPLKGIELAIEAVSALPCHRRPRLIVAGGTSPGHDDYAAALRALAERSAARVEFLPAQSRSATAGLLAGAALLLVPSRSETFGLVALEAAASGTPVVAAASGGLVEAVADRLSGVLMSDRDPVRWAAAIDRLLADPARLAALGASAAEHASRHTWASTAAQLRRVYRHAVGESLPE